MNKCTVKPYEGTSNYIFISYCHKDKEQVFPIIEQLNKDGYRVWYDEGIDPGTEWPEIIATHLNASYACLAFISENSLNSHNCRREINFALLKKKPFICIPLEEVQMSLGMEMQLSATQAIFKYKFDNDGDFFRKLYDAKFLQECFGEEDKRQIPDRKAQKLTFGLLHLKTNQKVILKYGETNVGRSHSMCDYVITENATVGRLHAKVINEGSECYIVDNHSLNKTYLGNIELESGKKYYLSDGDTIRFSNEKFIFYKERSEE